MGRRMGRWVDGWMKYGGIGDGEGLKEGGG